VPSINPVCGNLVYNPSFELTGAAVGSAFTVGGWDFTGNGAAIQSNWMFCNGCIETPYGQNLVILAAAYSGQINSMSQTIMGLSVGVAYTLNYNYHIDRFDDVDGCTLTTSANGVALDVLSISSAGIWGNPPPYIARPIHFTATAETSTISFKQICTWRYEDEDSDNSEVTFLDQITMEVDDPRYCN
jgi:hypothetical protein